jgi:hypothetical protein
MRLLRRYAPGIAPVVPGAGDAGVGGVGPRAPGGRRTQRPGRSQAERTQGDDGAHQHLKLFRRGRPRPLSAILPVLENMGLTVLSEQPFSLPKSDLHIADFAVLLPTRRRFDDEATRQSLCRLARRPAARPGRERRFQPPGPAGGPRWAADQHPARLQPLPAAGRSALQPGLCRALSGDPFPDHARPGGTLRARSFRRRPTMLVPGSLPTN